MFKRWIVCLGLIGACVSTAAADRLYVRNRPFKGVLVGSAGNLASLRADVASLTEALGYQLSEIEGNWVVRRTAQEPLPQELVKGGGKLYVLGQPVPVVLDEGHQMVQLSAFAEVVGARVRRHPELGTIDLDLVLDPTKQGSAAIPGAHHLVFYGADFAPASKLYKPVVQEFDRKHIVPVIFVDCTQPRSVNYRNYIRHFQGNLLPYTVLLSPKGKVVKSWTGYQDLGPLTTEIQKLLKKSS
jgi:hypothetical protein